MGDESELMTKAGTIKEKDDNDVFSLFRPLLFIIKVSNIHVQEEEIECMLVTLLLRDT